MAAKGDIFEDLEDPAQHWVDLVGAYREHDLGATRRLILVAKQSNWTEALWKMEMAPQPGDIDDEAEVEEWEKTSSVE